MVDVHTTVIIDAPARPVADFAMNPDNAPAWYVNIRSVSWKTFPPLTAGSKVAFKANFMGRELSYTYEVTEYIPGQKLIMKTAEGPFPMETSYIFESTSDNKTRMTLRNTGKPAGFSKIFSPFISMMMRRANKKDLVKLKAILEGKIASN